MIGARNLTDFQKSQLLEFFFHYLSQEDRARLMATLPRAYNAWCGQTIVKVWNASHENYVRSPLDQCEAQNNQEQW